MTDEQAREDTSAETVTQSVSPGRMLREGRERLNLSHEQVAERLRLRQQIVVDLEADQFDKHVAGTFTRGYLRAYARLVNVDEAQVLAAYASLGVNDKPQNMQSFSRRTRQQSQDNRLMLVTYIIGAIIIGSAIIFWLQNNNQVEDDVSTPRQEQSVAERMVAEQDAQVEIAPAEESSSTVATREPIFIDTSLLGADRTETTETGASEAQLEADTEAALREAEEDRAQQQIADAALAEQAAIDDQRAADALNEEQDQAQSSNTDQDEAAAPPEQSALPDAELVLMFTADTWIRIEDGSAEAIAFGVKSEGHVSALNGEPPYDITLGAPENVTLYYQGSQVDLSSYRAGRVARLTLPATE